MKLTIELDMDNAAFEEFPFEEAGRILREITELVEKGIVESNLLDINGNTVGLYKVTNWR